MQTTGKSDSTAPSSKVSVSVAELLQENELETELDPMMANDESGEAKLDDEEEMEDERDLTSARN